MSKVEIKVKKMCRCRKGITLISLIITIIVMIILVGVTVTVALNGGVFNKEKEAVSKTQIELEREQLLEAALGTIDKSGKINFEILNSNLPEGFTEENGIYIGKSGNKFTVNEYGEIQNYKSEKNSLNIVQTFDKYPITSVVIEIKPEIKSESEAVSLFAKYLNKEIGNDEIKTFEDIILFFINQENSDPKEGNGIIYTKYEDLVKDISPDMGIENPTIQQVFSYITGEENIQSYFSDSYMYAVENKTLKINGNTVTDEAEWDGDVVKYSVKENGSYKVELELDENIISDIANVTMFSLGKYVKYDSDGDKDLKDEILYRVLYCDDELGKGEGAQLISDDVLLPESVHIGYGDEKVPTDGTITEINGDNNLNFEKAVYSYNNAIDTLNKKCASLPQAKSVDGITKRVRSVGSDPLIEKDMDGYYPGTGNTVMKVFDNLAKEGNSNIPQDWTRTEVLNINTAENNYWLASRYPIYYFRWDLMYQMRFYDSSSNKLSNRTLFGFNANYYPGYDLAYGVRPVINLEPKVLLEAIFSNSGSGTAEDPYILSK